VTPRDADLKGAALEALRKRWEDALLPRVRSRVADAHAHALKALTGVLKQTPDGRPSLLRINASPSYAAALSRLAELWAWLAGSSEVSLKGKVRDARAAFYEEAARLWFPLVPPAYRSRSDPAPTLAQLRLARAVPVHGYDVRKALQGPIQTAGLTLKVALEQAGRRSTPSHVEDDLLAHWEARTASSLSQSVVGLLNDGVEHADTRAGRDLIKPEYLDEPLDVGA
jgi:hypothetical protein